jgi:hypothetical protein
MRAPFLDLCADKGATLSVIQSDNGRVFGGYTSNGWGREHWTYVEDDKAWLFSMDNQTKLNIKQDQL